MTLIHGSTMSSHALGISVGATEPEKKVNIHIFLIGKLVNSLGIKFIKFNYMTKKLFVMNNSDSVLHPE